MILGLGKFAGASDALRSREQWGSFFRGRLFGKKDGERLLRDSRTSQLLDTICRRRRFGY